MTVSSVQYGIRYLRKVSCTQKKYFLRVDNASAIDGVDAKAAADRIMGRVIPLGQRFYPSEGAFPLRKSFPGELMRAPFTFVVHYRAHRFAPGPLCSGSQGRATLWMGPAYPDPVWRAIPGSMGYFARDVRIAGMCLY